MDETIANAQFHTNSYFVARPQCHAKGQGSSFSGIYAEHNLVSGVAVRLDSRAQVLEVIISLQSAVSDVVTGTANLGRRVGLQIDGHDFAYSLV